MIVPCVSGLVCGSEYDTALSCYYSTYQRGMAYLRLLSYVCLLLVYLPGTIRQPRTAARCASRRVDGWFPADFLSLSRTRINGMPRLIAGHVKKRNIASNMLFPCRPDMPGAGFLLTACPSLCVATCGGEEYRFQHALTLLVRHAWSGISACRMPIVVHSDMWGRGIPLPTCSSLVGRTCLERVFCLPHAYRWSQRHAGERNAASHMLFPC